MEKTLSYSEDKCLFLRVMKNYKFLKLHRCRSIENYEWLFSWSLVILALKIVVEETFLASFSQRVFQSCF